MNWLGGFRIHRWSRNGPANYVAELRARPLHVVGPYGRSCRLGTHAPEFARADTAEGPKNLEHQRPKVNHSVRRCLDEDDAERLDGKLLLVREIPVHRDESVKGALHPTQKFAVLAPSQPSPLTVWTS